MKQKLILKDNDDLCIGRKVGKSYTKPTIRSYGTLHRVTQGSGGNGLDQATQTHTKQSDRRVKKNIVRIGTHPIGIGLYLFDYKTKFCDQVTDGRQFGVMADEVENIMPEAVIVGSDGYKRVNYGMLGIELNS